MKRLDLKPIAEFLVDLHLGEFIDQGHNLTGRGARSVEQVPTFGSNYEGFQIKYIKYLIYVNKGVRKDRIPFTRRGRRRTGGPGRTSKYIEGLKQFAKLRGMGNGDKELTRIAFAIAMKHKKEGMPTRGSLRYSSTGRRKGFQDVVLRENRQLIDQKVREASVQFIRETMEGPLVRFLE